MMSLTQQCLYILQTIFTLKTLFPAPPEAGISRDKTIDGKLMQTTNYDEQNFPICRLKSLVKSLNTARFRTNQSRLNYTLQTYK